MRLAYLLIDSQGRGNDSQADVSGNGPIMNAMTAICYLMVCRMTPDTIPTLMSRKPESVTMFRIGFQL